MNFLLNKYHHEDGKIFEWTQADIESKIDIGDGERMPTLEAVI